VKFIGDKLRVTIRTTPNAKTAELTRLTESEFKARVDAPALEGKANARLIEMLAEHFGVSKSKVRILRGATGRNKVIEIDV
jgi:uncharacterized protein (TIGR00251 family)